MLLRRPLPVLAMRRSAAVAAVATAALAAPSAAGAQVPREFFGVHGETAAQPMEQTQFNRMRSGRVGTLGLGFDWTRVQHTRGGTLDWSFYDESVRRAALAGVRVFARVSTSPAFAARNPLWPPDRANRGEWARFVAAAVKRYGRNGDFWRQHAPGTADPLPYKPIHAWQLWNEPNLKPYWNGRPNAREYASLARLGSRHVRAADPAATVVLAGLPQSRAGVPLNRFLTSIYRSRRDMASYFDAVAIHPYARNASGVQRIIRSTRVLMNRLRDPEAQIYLTESGWATGPRGTRKEWVTNNSGQARNLTQTFRMLVRNRERYRLLGVLWYSWRDAPVAPGTRDQWFLRCGLFDRRGRAKPSWSAYQRFSRTTVETEEYIGAQP